MKKYIFYALLALSTGWAYIYLGLPTISYGYYDFAFLFVLMSGIVLFSELLQRNKQRQKIINPIFLSAFILSVGYFIIVPILTSWPIFKSEKYRNLIGRVKIEEDFSNRVAPISTEEIRIVDQATAYRLGDKVLGSKPSLGSQTYLGNFSIQQVSGRLYWVAPLLHSGFFKWLDNKNGTPGYVMVSATNDRDVKLVHKVKNYQTSIKYQPEGFFSDNLARHIYFNGYMTKGFTDFTFEIDDDGKPFWIVTLYDKKIGFVGEDATGVLAVDAENGNIFEYSIKDAPKWIDRIQPAEFIAEQLDNWGKYVKGYWNLANENMLTTTEGISLVYGTNNRSYWYTGLTSVGSDEGTVGFVLVDTRTKETIWYKQIGATEQAAQQSAMGKVQEKRYTASFPITYNINGIPTYIMSLKDQAGLVKMIAMVSVEDYTIVGVGNNVKESLRSFKNSINSKGNAISPGSTVVSYEINSSVSRVSSDIRNGDTYYYLLLNNNKSKIFVGSSLISNELPLTRIGDSVLVKYDDDANEIVDITAFDNLNITLQKTAIQIKKEKEFGIN